MTALIDTILSDLRSIISSISSFLNHKLSNIVISMLANVQGFQLKIEKLQSLRNCEVGTSFCHGGKYENNQQLFHVSMDSLQ